MKQAWIDTFKQRYERLIMENFQMKRHSRAGAGFRAMVLRARHCCLTHTGLLRGPGAQDSHPCADHSTTSGMLPLLILGIRSATTVYFDIALLIALFGFVGSVALAKFLLRGEVIEP